jgi:hypothetical protein
VRTTVDATGLDLQDAVEQGAEVFVPADVEPRALYTTPQFEREILSIVEELDELLSNNGGKDGNAV